jgi:hypothetical protein
MVNASGKGVVAVTRNGEGDFWWFPDWKSAYTHPLIQYGDVICDGPNSIEKNWTRLELPWLLSVLVDPAERADILVDFKSGGWENWVRTLDQYRDRLWHKMLDKCNTPPTDADTIFKLIMRDRLAPTSETRKMSFAKKTEKTDAATVTNDAITNEVVELDKPVAAADAAPAEKAEKKKGTTTRKPPVREPKYSLNATIQLLANSEGVPYGRENNPKRPGSKAHDRFANYVNGMTVEQALAAGLTRQDLDFDIQKHYIVIK